VELVLELAETDSSPMEVDEKRLFQYHLDTLGERESSFEAQGAAAYLYNLQRPDRS
jgi:hypothetical protein